MRRLARARAADDARTSRRVPNASRRVRRAQGTPYYRDNDNAEVAFTEDRGAEGAGRYERLLLDHLQGFVINCERRSRHERRLRRGRTARHGAAAAAAAAPVLIPRGGVTADEDLELDDIYLVEDEEEAEGGEGAPFGL